MSPTLFDTTTCPNCGADDGTADDDRTVGDRDLFRCRCCGIEYDSLSMLERADRHLQDNRLDLLIITNGGH